MTHPHCRKRWTEAGEASRGLRSELAHGHFRHILLAEEVPRQPSFKSLGRQTPALAAVGVGTWRGAGLGSFS